MKKNLLVAAVSSAALLFASSAYADGGPVPEAPPPPPPAPAPEPEPAPAYEPAPAPEYNWYTTIFAGMAFGDDLEATAVFDFGENEIREESADIPLEPGYLLGWTLGYDNLFGGEVIKFRPEVELSFRQQDVDLEEGFDLLDIDVPDEDIDPFAVPVDLLTLMGNLWIDWDLGGATIYGGGGVGIGWADLPIFVESNDFAWQFGGGVNFDLNERVFLGIGYRYLGADFEEDVSQLGLFDLATIEYEYRTHEVLANLGVRF